MHELYLSTIDPNAAHLARTYGLGLEIAEFCTAWNMDEQFETTHAQVQTEIENTPNRLLHAPFNELFPCAIDPKARELAAYRYRQAVALAKRYDAKKVIVHGGYHPRSYYPVWYVEQSVAFWKAFLREDPGVEIVLENVLEEDPAWLVQIVEGVDDPRLRLCLDIGHVNVYSKKPVMDWLTMWAPYLRHFHVHNNDGSWDTHSPLTQGNIPMAEFLQSAHALCPDASITLELMDGASSLAWLFSQTGGRK